MSRSLSVYDQIRVTRKIYGLERMWGSEKVSKKRGQLTVVNNGNDAPNSDRNTELAAKTEAA